MVLRHQLRFRVGSHRCGRQRVRDSGPGERVVGVDLHCLPVVTNGATDRLPVSAASTRSGLSGRARRRPGCVSADGRWRRRRLETVFCRTCSAMAMLSSRCRPSTFVSSRSKVRGPELLAVRYANELRAYAKRRTIEAQGTRYDIVDVECRVPSVRAACRPGRARVTTPCR